MRVVKAWLPVAAMCVIIFLFSQDRDSGRHSNEVLSWILSVFGVNTPHYHRLLDGPFRKFAHVVVYFLLSVSSYRGFAYGQRWFSFSGAGRALIFTALYACTDEYHQTFTQFRDGNLHDVALDTCAALFALFLIWLFTRKPRTRQPVMAAVSSSD